MTQEELDQFLDDYRQAVRAGVDETPEWGVLITVTMEQCSTPEQHDALIRGLDVIILAHFRSLARR